jgi:DMSO reductase iron-sulfur subunit
MYAKRQFEPEYAHLPQVPTADCNRYGKPLQLVLENDPLAGKSLYINGDDGIGTHADRYKQHGFYFNADNCIACHACESACSEKNNLPPHLAFRSVGYVEGGTWPDYRRINISMACNHCDDPVCLKGCPTRAYTKFAEYGAVLQDPDICFGCGYCTWVCPYNAPQLDPVEGHVQKCNMCVDRLEVGLKPACVSACLAGALDFGVVETKPKNRDQLETHIPGFPTPDITHPNVRFQQTKSLPREMTRTDAMPLKYVRDTGAYKAQVRQIQQEEDWNLGKLRTREDPLVVFTLISQAVVGGFLVLFLGPLLGLDMLSVAAHPNLHAGLLFSLLAAETFALALSTMHLGKPHRFYRAFNNLRHSPVSREVAGIAVFFNLLGLHTVLTAFPDLAAVLQANVAAALRLATGIGAAISGPVAIYFMYRIYRIPSRPFWNHWQTASAFFGNMLTLGAAAIGASFALILAAQGESAAGLMRALGSWMVLGLIIEGAGLIAHARDLKRQGGEGAASHQLQLTAFGQVYRLRNITLAIMIPVTLTLMLTAPDDPSSSGYWLLVTLLIAVTAVLGRALFYALVIPTTMPGAFFWRNKAFQEHAQASGLARMPQTGIVVGAH